MLPAHVSSSRRGCPGSPARSRGQLGSRSGRGHGTGHPPPAPSGSAGSTPGYPCYRCRGAAVGGRTRRRCHGHPSHTRRQGCCSPAFGGMRTESRRRDPLPSREPPTYPPPRHRPDLPASGRGGSAAMVPGELFPGHAVGRAAEVRSDHKPPKAVFPKLSCKAAPGAGGGGSAGKGGTLVSEPPGGSGQSRAGPAAPDTAAGAAVSDGPVSSGEQSPIPPSGPIPGAGVGARPGRSRGGQA